MNISILSTVISDKDDYLLIINMVNNNKTNFTTEEIDRIYRIYVESNPYNITNEYLLRAFMVLDTINSNELTTCRQSPLHTVLSDKDIEAIDSIITLFKDTEPNIESSMKVKDMALDKNVSLELRNVLVRAALDRFSHMAEIHQYTDIINQLIEIINGIDDETFKNMSMFLIYIKSKFYY